MKALAVVLAVLLLLQVSFVPVPPPKDAVSGTSEQTRPILSTIRNTASVGTNLLVSPSFDGYPISSSFTISVDTTNVPKLYSYDFYLDYNSTSLGLLGVGCESGTMFGGRPHFVVACGPGNSTGTVHVAETLLGNTSATGSGHLLFLNFTVNNLASGASALHISHDVLIDSNFANISHTTTDGVFYVYLPPIASFNISAAGGENQLFRGRTLVFNASASRDPDSTYDPHGPIPLVCRWDFGDGSSPSTGCVITHSYISTGTYPVTLSVTDNEGSTTTASSSIVVVSNPDFDGSGCVDIRDIARVAFRFGTKVGDVLYNPLYDMNNDGTIDIVDVVVVASNYGKCGYPVLDFSISKNATSLTVNQGSSRALTLMLTSINGFSGNITLTTATSPTVSNTIRVSLSQTMVDLVPGATANVGLSTSAENSTTPGNYNITVTAASQFHSHAVTIPVKVQQPTFENLHLEMYTFSNSTSSTLYLRNAGPLPVSLITYYLIDSSNDQYSKVTWSGPTIAPNALATTYINIGASCPGCTLSGTAFTFTSGNSYTVVVVTSHGNQFTFMVNRGGQISPLPPVGESLVLQNYAFTSNSTALTMTLSNNGTSPVSLVTYYVRDTNGDTYMRPTWVGPTMAANASGLADIGIGASCESCTLSGSAFTFTSGYSYTVYIVTSKNNEFILTVTR